MNTKQSGVCWSQKGKCLDIRKIFKSSKGDKEKGVNILNFLQVHKQLRCHWPEVGSLAADLNLEFFV